jgi:hypothetical protein
MPKNVIFYNNLHKIPLLCKVLGYAEGLMEVVFCAAAVVALVKIIG